MKKSALLILLFSTLLHAQEPTENYTLLWQEVEQFELDNLPKSANKIVDKIYTKAKKEKNAPQVIKSLLFQSKFALILEEDAQLNIIHNFEKEIAKADFPTKNILESVLANLYWQYFQQNRWKFYNRTKTAEKVDSTDFRTWDLKTLFKEIHIHFQNSLKNGLLAQQTALEGFKEILTNRPESKLYRPTLYDFLVHNALDFYKTDETHLTKPAYKFEIDNSDFLGDAKTFSRLPIETKDSLSLQYHALLLFKKLTAFHLDDKDPTALITLDLERMYFVKQKAAFSDKEAVFLQSVLIGKEHYKNHSISTLYDYEIASLYQQQGQIYHPKTAKENQWKIKEAIAKCEEAIQTFPKSRGAEKCMALKTNMLKPSLNLTTEEFIVPNRPARILVKHKNTDYLAFKVAKISENQRKKLQKTYNFKEQIAFIQNLKVTEKWATKIKNEGDYQMHSSEVVIPKLPQGTYLIYATPDKDSINTFAFTYLQATDLALVEINSNQQQILQVVDRYYGNPLEGAKVHLTNYNSGRYSRRIDEVLSTDALGQIYLPNDDYYSNVKATVRYGHKYGVFGDYYIRESYKNHKNQKNYYQAFLFTDRSIYRLGQTLFFKGIVVKRKPRGKQTYSEVLSDEKVKMRLTDVNGQEVGEMDLVTNEFGSVSGEFILPEGGLTGSYYINLKGKGNTINTGVSIAVEEYKRPKFETEFKPVTDSFKVNDTVKVTGIATAYAGSAITEAKVVYRVHRKVQYPRWWYWYRPMHISEPQEITHGETITDATGNYEISFKAQPDKSVAKADLPIFHYEITADVTDINGETRSSKTTVQVGYHSVLANINSLTDWNQNQKEHKIVINTTNLNGEKVAVAGSLKIYKLKSPITPKRKRPWETPDYQNLTQADFFKLFPHESYSDTDQEQHWENGDLVYTSDFKTSKEDKTEILIKQKGSLGFKKWALGKYQIVLETKDKFGQKVTDKHYITLFNNETKQVADAKLISVQKNQDTYKIGDSVCLRVGSALDNVTVSVLVEKDHKISNTYLLQLSNEIKTLEIPVKSADIGGFSIHYHLVNYNSFVSGKISIVVPLPQEDLEIETLTFRDKVQPGSEQTWSFKLKGTQKDKFAAEFLASMYDASLDQFKSHQWNMPTQGGVRSYYSSYNTGAYHSFKNTNFNVRKLKTVYPKYPKSISYDRLNWFGFSLNYNKWQYQQYLRTLNSQRSEFDGIVTGIVSDETGPLPGVSVLIKGTTFGAETDFDGKYSIKVKKGDELQFNYIGMKTVSKTIANQKIIDVTMESDENNVLDEVVVTGYGRKRKGRNAEYAMAPSLAKEESDVANALAGKIAGVQVTNSAGSVGASSRVVLRGMTSLTGENQPLLVVDGIVITDRGFNDISPNDIFEIKVLKGPAATALYGVRAANGVIVVTTKVGQAKLNADLLKIQARTNFNETAFFYPQIQTDKDGNITFSFTIPEALTRWKLQLLGHTKELKTVYQSLTTLTQKDLMVIPNAPRFLREGDQITFSSKISNLTESVLSGHAQLVLTDALTGKEINNLIKNASNTQSFRLDAKGNTSVSWELSIPDALQAVQYKVVAKAGDFSDGEQNILPVLTNRMLVTESMPMWINSNETKTFTLDKLKSNTSTTLRNHKLTLEVTSNPVWYAVQALPYLMEYPYECSEQTFSRYYANSIATQIVNTNPKIKLVFDQWKNTDALLSNLEKNQELKSILIAETPWLRDAQSEAEQKKRIALLFDLNKMTNELKKAERKLAKMQMPSGGFPWFKGSRYPNRYITQHIATGFGHLAKLNVNTTKGKESHQILSKAIKYLDIELLNDYNELLKRARIIKEKADSKTKGEKAERDYLAANHLGNMQLQYLYMRSFFKDISINDKLQVAIDYYTQQSYTYWKDYQLYQKGLIALVAHRNEKSTVASAILKSLDENSITSAEMGMYWKSNQPSWYWYQAPIETQALMIETFAEIENDIVKIDNLKKWLLKNKQTNRWKTTKATTEAVYALLAYGTDWTENQELVEVKIGNEILNPMTTDAVRVEAGTGYFKTSWNGNDIQPNQAIVTLTKKDKGIAWGALYWQYFEDLDKITHAKTPLQITKKLFLKENSDTGEVITEITDKTDLKVGDLVRVRIELKVDREMDFVHMKDMRASGLEPVNVLSQYKYQDGLGYYESTKDASTNFFFDHLRKGVYVFEYDLRANNAGDFSNGITTIQCMYAPEFTSHSEGIRVLIKN